MRSNWRNILQTQNMDTMYLLQKRDLQANWQLVPFITYLLRLCIHSHMAVMWLRTHICVYAPEWEVIFSQVIYLFSEQYT